MPNSFKKSYTIYSFLSKPYRNELKIFERYSVDSLEKINEFALE
ncbi:unknown protein [Waddlia chondrophila 2032/99]|uniref:Uncharacterized protein n=1 Tax=Waddlia chondrophila 2032/99 TaxID=765953 RepID=F8LD91_9BACT|nr:unknown protein [Waddlia chondrophila 2032/99]